MNISKHYKLFFSCFLVFAFVLPLLAPLAAAEGTDSYICVDGEDYRMSAAPYEGEYGMVACAEDLANAFGMEYAFDAAVRSFTLYDDINGEVVLMHKATRFYSGETVYNCLPYFYVENAVPMIDVGFFCEMFGAMFFYDEESRCIYIERGAAKAETAAAQPFTLLTAADTGSGTVSGTISYADGAPAGGLNADLLLSAVIAREELYGYGDSVLSPIVLGSTYLAEGETAASYSYDVSAFQGIYDSYILHCAVPELEYSGYANTFGEVTETEYLNMTVYSDANYFTFDTESIVDFPIVKSAVAFAYDGTTLTISGSGDLVTVPDEYSNATHVVIEEGITSIGAMALYRWSNLQSIILPDGIRSIGDRAFYYCRNLTSIDLPDSVKFIGEYAFYLCHSLKNIRIPDGVQSIGKRTFRGCGFVSVTIPDSVQSIGDEAFYNCYNLETIVIPDSVKRIGNYAFAACHSLRTIDLSDNVESIGNYAFYSCNALTSIALPASLTSIGYLMFGLCHSLTSITVDANNPALVSDAYGALYDRDMTTLLQYPTGNSRTEYTIPEGIKGIGDYAFDYADSLKTINVPDSVTHIGEYAFYYCSRLESVDIPSGVTYIGDSAFYSCRMLKDITIPESVTDIGYRAFYRCEGITDIFIPAGVGYIGSQAFARCTSLVSITVDANNPYYVNDAAGALYNQGVTRLIQYPAGSPCTEYAVPNGVTNLDSYAFYDCGNLQSITLPDSVGKISSYAFYNCSSLKSIDIPSGVTEINSSTFSGCCDLESITIPDSVEYIGSQAFSGCNDLENIVIADSVIEIGEWAFENCYSLTTVTIGNSVEYISYGAFYNCSDLESIVIPDSVIEIGHEAFANCYSLANVTFGSSLEYIGSYAFYNCEDLTSIYIPDNVTTIAADAFEGCDDLVIYRYSVANKMIQSLGIRIPDDDLALSDTPYKYQIAVLFAQAITGKTDLSIWNAEKTSVYFTDVTDYGTAIDYLAGLNVITETDSDTFGYADTVMYQDLLVYAVRALGYETADMQYPYGHILAAQKLELLDGIDIVNYKQVVTVGETMQLLWNMLNTEVAVIDPLTEKILYPGEVGMTETTTGVAIERNTLLEQAGFVPQYIDNYYIVIPNTNYEVETTENEGEYTITVCDLFDLDTLCISAPIVRTVDREELLALQQVLVPGNLLMRDADGVLSYATESKTIEQALLELHGDKDAFVATVTAFKDESSITVLDGATEVVGPIQALNSISITVGLLDQTGFDWEGDCIMQDEMHIVGVPYAEDTYAGVNYVKIDDAAYYKYTVDLDNSPCAVAAPTHGVYSQFEIDAAANGWLIKAIDEGDCEYYFTTDLYTVASFDTDTGDMTLTVLKVLTAVPDVVDSVEATVTEFIEADEDDEESYDTVTIDYTYTLADGTQIHEIGIEIAAADVGITADTPKISYLGLPVTLYLDCAVEQFTAATYDDGIASIVFADFAEYTEVENLGNSGNIKVVASSISDENAYVELAGEKFANSAYEISLKVWDEGWSTADNQAWNNFFASFCYDAALGYLGSDAANPFAAYATELNSYGKVAYRVIPVDGGKDILEILYTPYTFGQYIERELKYNVTATMETFKIIGNYTGTEFTTVDGETTWFEERFVGSSYIVSVPNVSKSRGEASLEATRMGEDIQSGDFMFYHYNEVDNILTVAKNCGKLQTGKMTAVNTTKEAVKIDGTNYPIGFTGVYPACSVYDYDRIRAMIMSLVAGQENVQYLVVDGNVVFYTEYGSSLPKEYNFAVISTDAEIMTELLGITELKYQQSLVGAFDDFDGHYVKDGYVAAAFLNLETGEWELGNIAEVATTYADGEFGDFCDVATLASYFEIATLATDQDQLYRTASLMLMDSLFCVVESADGVYTLADADTVDADGAYLIDRLENTTGLIFNSVGVTNTISASGSVAAARVYTNESTVIAAIGAGGVEVRRGQQSGTKSIEGTVTFFAADADLIVLTTDADISGWGDREKPDVKYYVTTPNTYYELEKTEVEDEYGITFFDLFDLKNLCVSDPVAFVGDRNKIFSMTSLSGPGKVLRKDAALDVLSDVTDTKTVEEVLLELSEDAEAFLATVTEFKDVNSITLFDGDTEVVNASQAVNSLDIHVVTLDLTEYDWDDFDFNTMYVAGIPYADGVYDTDAVEISGAAYYRYAIDMESPLVVNAPVVGVYSQLEIDAAANGRLIKAVDVDDEEYLFTTEIYTVASFDTTTGDMTLTVLKVLIPVEEHTCDFGDWIVRVAATTTAEGEKYRVCSICGATEVQTIPVVQQGDIDGDGEISIVDTLVVLKAVLNNADIENADMNGDGKVSLLDVLRMLKLSTQ